MTPFTGWIANDHKATRELAGLLARSDVRASMRIGAPDVPPQDSAQHVIMRRGTAPPMLARDQITRVVTKFNEEWDL